VSADYNEEDHAHSARRFRFPACLARGPGGNGKTQAAVQEFLQIELYAVLETGQHEEQPESLQGAEQELQKRMQGITGQAAE
jgi:hypothetical protein